MACNFELARACHAYLRQLVIAHTAGSADAHALRKAIDLCRTALGAVNDEECIETLGTIEDLARELFSDGTAVLKMELLRALSAYRSRIAHLQLQEVGMLVPQVADLSGRAERPSLG